MNQGLTTLSVDQQAISVLISNGVKPYLGMLEYLERHENLMVSVTPDNKDDAMLFKKVADEISGVIKDHRTNGKIAREYPNALSKAIIATENEIAEPAEKMKDFFMAGYKTWKAADDERKAAKREAAEREAKRVASISALIAEITAIPGSFLNATASEIASAYEFLNLRDLEAEGFCGEFIEKANEEKAKALEALKTAIDRAIAHEEQARQFAEMKRQQEEAQAAIKAQQEEIARQQAELQRQQQEAAKAKLEAERAELAAKRQQQEEEARKIKEEQDRLAREAQAKADAEAKAQADKEEAARQAALAPDKDKLMKYAADLLAFAGTNVPALQSKEANELFAAVVGNLNKISVQLQARAQAL